MLPSQVLCPAQHLAPATRHRIVPYLVDITFVMADFACPIAHWDGFYGALRYGVHQTT